MSQSASDLENGEFFPEGLVSDSLNLQARLLLLPPEPCLLVLVFYPLHFLLQLERPRIEIWKLGDQGFSIKVRSLKCLHFTPMPDRAL